MTEHDDDFTEENADELADELMGSLDKIFETDLVADEQRPVAKDPREPWCSHKRVRLSEARRVYCRDCKREVPAFDVLEDLAHDWERYMHTREDAQKRSKTAQANLIELLRLERNAKSRVRSALKRAPRCSCSEDQREEDTKTIDRMTRLYTGGVGLPDNWRSTLPWCARCGGRW